MTTYKYDNDAVLGIKIKKMKVYSDKIEIIFADKSISDVEKVECYGRDFEIIDENPKFFFRKNKLIIETSNADSISGITVVENEDLYFEVRYLDSDSYAMLVYSFASDIGYIVSGDENTYYTQVEKEEAEKESLAIAEAENLIYNKLLGMWKNESETVCIEFSYDEDNSNKKFVVYKFEENKWIEQEVISISDVSEDEFNESLEIALFDNPSWGCLYRFYLYDDNKVMECHYSDEKFIKID
ncbi:MAG: hypothetical protein IJA34_11970 [Lachnospiraceae bacterium]|nr:hypothetical protein [Lachnospiraceae bacterium]